jgi:3-hydroxybutyryl-CoA dehydrogenase
MKVHVIGNEKEVLELTASFPEVTWVTTSDLKQAIDDAEAEMILMLNEDGMQCDYGSTSKTILVNAVSMRLSSTKHGEHVVRFNGWSGFLSRKTWELSGKNNLVLESFSSACGITMHWLPDEPGFVAPRVISMIINEAFFAMEQSVSEVRDIDVALKLGTNYPYGPFEWAEKIGLSKVKMLLDALTLESPIYKPSDLLSQKVNSI